MSAADCRSYEVAKSREDAASMGRHPTMSKKKHALVLGLLASNRSNSGLRLGVRMTPLVLIV
jgi:hypothetical protein